jgi:hypothetical protein
LRIKLTHYRWIATRGHGFTLNIMLSTAEPTAAVDMSTPAPPVPGK